MIQWRRYFNERFFWPAWIAGVCMFGVMCGFAAVTDYFPGDLGLARRIQDLDDWGFGPLADFANAAGDTPAAVVITAAIIAVFAVLRQPVEAIIIVLGLIPRGSRQLLAEIIGRPRPSGDLLEIRDHAVGNAFPSGHATTGMVMYGALFVLAGVLIPHHGLRVLFRVVCVFMIVATGLARVYSGVHWPSDVVGGYVFGFLFLALLFFLFRRALASSRSR